MVVWLLECLRLYSLIFLGEDIFMLETSGTFLDYRKNQEVSLHQRGGLSGSLTGLGTIEINITDLCNRKCEFCPRVDPDVYPNRNVFISLELIEKIAGELKDLSYQSKISFSGFGEPLLNKEFLKIIAIFRKYLGSSVILETNTNGDKLNPILLNDLRDAGLDSIYWNLYDGPHQVGEAEKIIKDSFFPSENIRLRPHWAGFDSSSNVGLFLNNRSGAVGLPVSTASVLPLRQGCNYPFYKMLIDWDGNVLCCSNDWMRKRVVGNVGKQSLISVWLSEEMDQFRRRLLSADRNMEPCKTCDVNGLLFGDLSVQLHVDRMGIE
jgi:radical SAM protein with 4Fe4S-binding SPASM domain